MKELTFGQIVRRFVLYIALAFAALAVFALLAILSIRTGISVPTRWFGLVFWTAILFWWVTKPLKRYWRRQTFWWAVSGLFILHLLALVAVLVRYPQWPLVWFVPLSIVEGGAFTIALAKLFDHVNS